jgi:hypothetical protein
VIPDLPMTHSKSPRAVLLALERGAMEHRALLDLVHGWVGGNDGDAMLLQLQQAGLIRLEYRLTMQGVRSMEERGP